jgi:biopolymer transport protein ExbD
VLKRPTTRRRGHAEQIELNLVPMLDALVTLISFLLFTMSFLSLASIETPFPEASARQNEQKIKEKPLQLTVSIRSNNVEISSPFNRVASQTIASDAEGKPNTIAIHEALLKIKERFPEELSIVIAPYAGLNYDLLVQVMDAVRTVEPTDPPIFRKNPATGLDEPVKSLFPNVIFGNLLGNT